MNDIERVIAIIEELNATDAFAPGVPVPGDGNSVDLTIAYLEADAVVDRVMADVAVKWRGEFDDPERFDHMIEFIKQTYRGRIDEWVAKQKEEQSNL